MKSFELSSYIARKINSAKEVGQVSLSVRIATISVAISVIVMLVSSAVASGFRNDISDKLFDFSSDFQIVEATNYSYSNNKTISTQNNFIQQVENLDYVDNVSVFAFKQGIVKGKQSVSGVLMKGVGADYDWSNIADYIVEGSVLNTTDSVRSKKILISKSLSDKIGLTVDDKVEVVYFDNGQRRDLFIIGGVYRASVPEVDDMLVICDIRDIRRVNGWSSDKITGYDLRLTSGDYYHFAKENIEKILYLSGPSAYRAEALVDTRNHYVTIFGWLDMMKVNEYVIITIMLIVSIFNVVSMVLVILLQKTSMIGILKSLGMGNMLIQMIFLMRSMKYLVNAIVIGNVVGLLLCYVQKEFKLITLDSASYMLSSVPIDLSFSKVVFINLVVIVVLLLFQFIATSIVSNMQPYNAIKYEKR